MLSYAMGTPRYLPSRPEPIFYRENILAHAALGKNFKNLVIITSSAQTGPNGLFQLFS